MAELSRRKIIWEGAIAGLIGGGFFASGQILAGALSGTMPGAPWQFFTSIATGPETLENRIGFGNFFLGALVHFSLATLFGMFFGFIVAKLDRPVRNNLTIEIAGGAAYALVLWAINFELIGRWLYPWFTTGLNPAVQALIHALFYGVPMATWLALHIRDVETPGVHAVRHRYQTSSGDEEYLRLQQWQANNRAEHEVLGATRKPPDREQHKPLH